jgi:hypothetical protein
MSKGILIVGDIHGDWGQLNRLIQKKDPKEVWVVGDFGHWPSFEVRKATMYGQKDWSNTGVKVGNTVVRWCDGNHEDHDDLDNRGRIGRATGIQMYTNVMYQPRGSFSILPDGRRILWYGGAQSIDKELRTPGLNWFHREIPCEIEWQLALSYPEDSIDIVISHTCPKSWEPDPMKPLKCLDPTRQHLQDILEKYKPSLWYHGHWHKEASGVSGDTNWVSLDYPRHGGRWWTWLP